MPSHSYRCYDRLESARLARFAQKEGNYGILWSYYGKICKTETGLDYLSALWILTEFSAINGDYIVGYMDVYAIEMIRGLGDLEGHEYAEALLERAKGFIKFGDFLDGLNCSEVKCPLFIDKLRAKASKHHLV